MRGVASAFNPSAPASPTMLGAAPAPLTFPPAAPVAPAVDLTQRDHFRQIINDDLQAANLEGIDFLDFMNSLREVGTDDASFMVTLKVLKAQGATTARLIETAQHYTEVLAQTEADFNAHIQEQTAVRVEGPLADATALDTKVLSLQEQIAQLQAQIVDAQAAATSLRQTAVEAQTGLMQATAAFAEAKRITDGEFQGVLGKLQLVAQA